MSEEADNQGVSTPVDSGTGEGGQAPDVNPVDGNPSTPEGEQNGNTEENQPPANEADSGEPEHSGSGESSEAPQQDSADSEIPSELYFNGEQVQIEVPDELKEHLSGTGVDVSKVVTELYGKDSDFTLSEETRAPLDEKFGKPIVDTFLNALKSQNESVIKGAKDAEAAVAKANQEAQEWSNELVGGEENWTAMEKWASESLEEGQIESFNKAMESGDKWLQELAIKDLHQKFRGAEGDQSAELVSGDSTHSDSAGSPLSAQDYMAEMTSPEFMALRGNDKAKAQAQLDARRRAGMRRGL